MAKINVQRFVIELYPNNTGWTMIEGRPQTRTEFRSLNRLQSAMRTAERRLHKYYKV